LANVASPSLLVALAPFRLLFPHTVGVGAFCDDPDSLPLVINARSSLRPDGIGRRNNAPLRIEPHLGKVPENSIKSPASENWRVFHERESRLYFANDPRHFRPQSAPGSADTFAFPRRGDVLAGKSARYDVNTASPSFSIKRPHVIPDGKRRQESVVLSCDENACGIGVVLNGADGSPPEQFPAEYSSTSAREKSQLIHVVPSIRGDFSLP
jgi:hypothetical protein